MASQALRRLRKAVLDNRARLIAQEDRVVREVGRYVDRLAQEWIAELKRMTKRSRRALTQSDLAEASRRFSVLRNDLGRDAGLGLRGLAGAIRGTAMDVFKSESYRHTALVNGATVTGTGRESVRFGGLNVRSLNAAFSLKMPPELISGQLRKISAAAQKRIQRDLAEAISNGWNVEKLARRWRSGFGAVGLTSRHAETLARTMLFTASSNAQLAAYDATGRVDRVQWEATFDSRTCPQCASLHGKVFVLSSAPPLPAHFGCRCAWLPVIDGLSPTLGPYTRPSGVTVFRQQDRSFEKWLRGESAEIQRDFFSSDAKYRAFRSRRVAFDDLVRADGSFVTDQELAALLRP